MSKTKTDKAAYAKIINDAILKTGTAYLEVMIERAVKEVKELKQLDGKDALYATIQLHGSMQRCVHGLFGMKLAMINVDEELVGEQSEGRQEVLRVISGKKTNKPPFPPEWDEPLTKLKKIVEEFESASMDFIAEEVRSGGMKLPDDTPDKVKDHFRKLGIDV